MQRQIEREWANRMMLPLSSERWAPLVVDRSGPVTKMYRFTTDIRLCVDFRATPSAVCRIGLPRAGD